MLIQIFGFADQDKTTYGIGYNYILISDNNDFDIFRHNRVAAKKMF